MGVRVCGISGSVRPSPKRQKILREMLLICLKGLLLGYFWCSVAVIFISKYGIAVFRVQAVCGKFKFHVAVVNEKIAVSR